MTYFTGILLRYCSTFCWMWRGSYNILVLVALPVLYYKSIPSDWLRFVPQPITISLAWNDTKITICLAWKISSLNLNHNNLVCTKQIWSNIRHGKSKVNNLVYWGRKKLCCSKRILYSFNSKRISGMLVLTNPCPYYCMVWTLVLLSLLLYLHIFEYERR